MQRVAPRGAFKWLLQVLGLAAVYYVAGRLALLMAIPPGYATAAWPAAGIGVVALIVWGFRVWPAVALGSFLINATLSLAAPLGSGQQVLVAAGISLGATLQALAGAALVRRWVDPSILFAREKAIVKLLVLAGPIACLISASVAVGTLYLAQVVPISDVPFHWWTWWIGDTIGVLLVGPVYLTWSASAHQLSLLRKIQLSIALTVLAALVVLTFVHTSALEQQRIEADFSRRTEHLTGVLTLKVGGYTDVLEAIGDLYASDAQVSRGQFATFVKRSLLGRPGIQALSWNPLVRESERAGFEANARAEGYRNFRITELAADGHLQPASPRPLYVPIQHIEPYADNQSASGFDVASDVDRYAALMAARDTGRLTATGSITLVQAAGHYGFLLALPVYHAAGQPQQHLRGYAVAAFRMQDVMATFLRGQDTTGMRIRLVDEQADVSRRVLYEKRSPTTGQPSNAVDVHDIRVKTASIEPAEGFARRSTITMGGRALTLQLDATPDYPLTQRSWLAWAVLVIGLLFTAMLGAFMLVVAGRAGLIEEVVVQRTAQLRNSNQELEIARRGLAENERGLEEAQKIARVGSWQWDVVADKVSSSDELYRIFGADRHALTPNFQSYLEHAHPEDRQRVDSAVRRALAAHQPFTLEHRIIRPDGAVRVMQANGRVAADDDGSVLRMLGTVQDVTEIKDAEQRLLQLAHFDTLTALPNRALFYKSLHDSLAQAGKQGWIVSVLFLDIDNFKNVNDTMGHASGDELLRQVAGRLADTLRVRDTVARFGGDEFAIMLVNLDDRHDAATLVADKLRQVLRTPFILEGQEVTVTASIGATVFPADSTDADELLKYADTAMYAAKEAGRDTYRFYTAAMNANVVRRLALDTALRRALERNEFVLHYQPKIELASGRWTGVEALLRWNRPGHGLVPPGDFIPLLEETGLIEPVGAWVINEACRQIASWRASGLAPVPIAVNVSVKQLLHSATDTDEQSALEQTIEHALREHDVAPHLLEIELTESTLMSHVVRTVDLLHRLTALGIQVAIDDFGTGYSSLAYLKRFSVTIIKIDQTFVRDISSNADDASITAAIISMSHSLKLRVIAEGVETPEQLAFLQEHGCDGAQGYLLARPMPAEACAELLRTPGFRSEPA